jgi:hypothetical protein
VTVRLSGGVGPTGSRAGTDCRRWPARPDARGARDARLVATAAENRVSFRRNPLIYEHNVVGRPVQVSAWRITMTKSKASRASKFTPQAIEKIKEMVAQGLNGEEIGHLLDVTVGSLQVTLKIGHQLTATSHTLLFLRTAQTTVAAAGRWLGSGPGRERVTAQRQNCDHDATRRRAADN